MAGTKINNYGSTNTSLTAIMQTIDADRVGKTDSIGLTNMSTTSIPAIESGSIIEIANSVYRFSTAEPISTTSIASTAATYWYVELVPSSSTVSARFSTTVPVWRSDYQGFYTSTTSANRMIGKVYFSGTTYDQKAILRWNDRIYVNSNQNNAVIVNAINNGVCVFTSSYTSFRGYSEGYTGFLQASGSIGLYTEAANVAICAYASVNNAICSCAVNTVICAIASSYTSYRGLAVGYTGFLQASSNVGLYTCAVNTGICAVASANLGIDVNAASIGIRSMASSNFGICACAVNYAGYFTASQGYAICAVASSNVGIYASAVCNAGIFCASNNYAICAEASSNTAIYASAANTAIYACSAGNTAIRACASSNYGLIGCAISCYGTFSCAVSCLAIVGKSAGWAVCGCATSTTLSTTGEGYPVSGNGVYWNTSDKHLKYLQNVCVTQCLKDRPLTVYKYIWSDQNQTGWDEFISPTAQDLQNTFRLTERDDGMFTTDGIALGLGIELMKDKADKTELQKLIETLKQSTALGANYGN